MRVAAVVLFVAVAVAAIAPIHSYDFFWHLATGRWIVDHHALPATDPFGVASDRVPWINGEWLFEVALAGIHALGGSTAIVWARALFVALIFTLAFLFASRESDWPNALFLTSLAFAGAHDRLDARPSTAAALLVIMAISLARRSRIAFLVVAILWINVHPSAVLAPVIALVAGRSIALAAATAGALLLNPHGWRAIVAPLELTRFASEGSFVNAEWLPSLPNLFPLLYITIAIGVAVCLLARDRRSEWWRFVLFAMFAALAVRHVRNQGLYYAAFPVLIAPLVPQRIPRLALIAASAVSIGWVLATAEHGAGIEEDRFPVRAVARLEETPFRGNIYNPDQFGGYLIWSFYPERRVLTDGRNEIYRAYIPEYARARNDNRAWDALLRKYRIDIAVDEYRPGKIEVLDYATKQRRLVAPSQVYFPRDRWALIAYDKAGMVFVRRAAFSAQDIAKFEIRGVTPDG